MMNRVKIFYLFFKKNAQLKKNNYLKKVVNVFILLLSRDVFSIDFLLLIKFLSNTLAFSRMQDLDIVGF